jgi:Domain of Unknown Function (DUF928)
MMNQLKSISASIPALTIAFFIVLPNIFSVTIVLSADAPPGSGRPGRRSDAGSRGCGEIANGAESQPDAKPLLALVPIEKTSTSTMVFGKTAATHPTLWFYVPQRSAATAIFVLQDQAGRSVYQSDVKLPKISGIVSLTIPATVAPLEIGQPYHWYFKLYCRPSSPPDLFVDGWIQREALTATLTQKIKTATRSQQVKLYNSNGFWFEALNTAAELRRTNSSDSEWAELLGSIGLESLLEEPIGLL